MQDHREWSGLSIGTSFFKRKNLFLRKHLEKNEKNFQSKKNQIPYIFKIHNFSNFSHRGEAVVHEHKHN